MSSQQRNYRPPTLTVVPTLLARNETLNIASSDTQDPELSQSSTSAQQGSHHSSVISPTPADHAADSITQEQLEAQRTSSQHLIYTLLVSTPRRSLADRLEKLNTEHPTTADLADFQKALGQECLLRCLQPNANPTVSSGTLLQVTLYLSGPLLQWTDAQSGRFRDLQLRALVAALALLHHSGLTELTAEPHDQLRLNIAARFNEIIDGRSPSQMSLEHRMRKADARYLIRLAAQYFSLIKRAQPLSDAVPTPIIGLVLAGASIAGGQYSGLGSVFRYADQFIGLIPARKSGFLHLPAIQELTRNATTVFSLSATGNLNHVDVEENETALGLVQLLQQLLRVHLRDIPSRRHPMWDWLLARSLRGPPLMDKWYFLYGLLDCLGQVARHARTGQLDRELFSMLKQLVEESECEEFRWKVLEIFDAYEPVRRNVHQWLTASHGSSNIDNADISLELAAVRTIARQQVLTDVEAGSHISRQTTSSSGTDDGRFSSGSPSSPSQAIDNRPLYPALVEAQYSNRRTSASAAGVDAIEQLPMTHQSVLTSSTDEQGRSLSLGSQQQVHTPATEEAEEPEQYLEGHIDYWPQDGHVHEGQLLPRGIFGRSLRGYAHAGLSTDCRLAFFSSSEEVCVARVSLDNGRRRKEDLVLERKYDKSSQIADVALLNSILAVSTRQNLELHRIGLPGPKVMVSHRDWDLSHRQWDPLGIASWEQGSEAMVAVGFRRGAGNSRDGRVIVHQVIIPPAGPVRIRILRKFSLPRGESPKFLAFDSEGAILACLTDRNVGNTVVIWKIKEPPEEVVSTVITRHQHRPETASDGLTSVAIYISPSQQRYVLCTTSASTERFRSQGEWPFISPVVPANEQILPKTVHDLTALQDHRQIVAGAVSSSANKYAVLTKSGKILVLSLYGHEDGGICSLEDAPDILPLSLCPLKSSRATPTCLRFDPSGTKLYAIDPEGKLITVMFRPED